MKYLDEYRDSQVAQKLVDEIRRAATRPWVLMEVCGGQTHSIVKYGLDALLPQQVELVHGPGCPGVRHVARDDRPGSRHCAEAQRYFLLVRRHAAGARFCERSLQDKGRGWKRSHCLLAAGLPEDRAGESGQTSSVLRYRIRNHGAGERNGGFGRPKSKALKISPCWCPTFWCHLL